MQRHTGAHRVLELLAVPGLLVALLALPTLAEAAPGRAGSLIARASWHGRPIERPLSSREVRTERPVGYPGGWSAGAAKRGLGFVRAGGSARVAEVQRLLVRLGYRPGQIDGRFGPRTEAAVIDFQYKHGLARTGVVAARTLNVLRLRVRAGLPAGWRAGPVRLGSGYRRRGGSRRVREVQRGLDRLGYRSGPTDGLFGPRTAAATRAFQRSRRLPVDGVVGRRTLRELAGPTAGTRPPRPAVPPVPNARSVPPRVPNTLGQPRATPRLPAIPLILGLVLLGLATFITSYVVAGRRISAARPTRDRRAPTRTVGEVPRVLDRDHSDASARIPVHAGDERREEP
jgi:peptidoglycan hydrolase-like protein with peptidoglycan-binding domain